MSTNTSLLAWTDWTSTICFAFSGDLKPCKETNLAELRLVGGSDQISQVLLPKGVLSQVLLEEREEGGQLMFVGVRMPETVTFARVNLNTG